MDGTTQDPSLEARVGRLEGDMHEVNGTLGRLEPLIVTIHAQMPYLATKAGLERVRGEIEARLEGVRGGLEAKIEGVRGSLEAKIEGVLGDLETKIEGLRGEVRAGLAAKPGYGAMWSMAITLLALVVAAMSAGAAWLPLLARSIHAGP